MATPFQVSRFYVSMALPFLVSGFYAFGDSWATHVSMATPFQVSCFMGRRPFVETQNYASLHAFVAPNAMICAECVVPYETQNIASVQS